MFSIKKISLNLLGVSLLYFLLFFFLRVLFFSALFLGMVKTSSPFFFFRDFIEDFLPSYFSHFLLLSFLGLFFAVVFDFLSDPQIVSLQSYQSFFFKALLYLLLSFFLKESLMAFFSQNKQEAYYSNFLRTTLLESPSSSLSVRDDFYRKRLFSALIQQQPYPFSFEQETMLFGLSFLRDSGPPPLETAHDEHDENLEWLEKNLEDESYEEELEIEQKISERNFELESPSVSSRKKRSFLFNLSTSKIKTLVLELKEKKEYATAYYLLSLASEEDQKNDPFFRAEARFLEKMLFDSDLSLSSASEKTSSELRLGRESLSSLLSGESPSKNNGDQNVMDSKGKFKINVERLVQEGVNWIDKEDFLNAYLLFERLFWLYPDEKELYLLKSQAQQELEKRGFFLEEVELLLDYVGDSLSFVYLSYLSSSEIEFVSFPSLVPYHHFIYFKDARILRISLKTGAILKDQIFPYARLNSDGKFQSAVWRGSDFLKEESDLSLLEEEVKKSLQELSFSSPAIPSSLSSDLFFSPNLYDVILKKNTSFFKNMSFFDLFAFWNFLSPLEILPGIISFLEVLNLFLLLFIGIWFFSLKTFVPKRPSIWWDLCFCILALPFLNLMDLIEMLVFNLLYAFFPLWQPAALYILFMILILGGFGAVWVMLKNFYLGSKKDRFFKFSS